MVPAGVDIRRLQKIAWELRYRAIEMISRAGSGHPGPSLSVADIITALYFQVLNVDPQNPEWPERDRLVLSKGHACPILYAALARRGFFEEELLWTLRRPGSKLQGHPDMRKLPGIDMTTGSLGNGLSVGLGMALAAKIDSLDYHVFVILGDGELQEGLVWEAAMAAGHYHVDNLIAIVDNNGLQSSGRLEDVMDLSPLADKWRAFGWEVIEADGHNMAEVVEVLFKAKEVQGKPTVIIAHTTKGKGVSFMEGRYEWHSRSLKPEETQQALMELATEVQRYE